MWAGNFTCCVNMCDTTVLAAVIIFHSTTRGHEKKLKMITCERQNNIASLIEAQHSTALFLYITTRYIYTHTHTHTHILNIDLKRQIDVFGNKCLHSIMGYRWNDFVSSQRLLCETDSRPITSIVRHRQIQLQGHVAHYPEADPACQVISEGDNPGPS